MKYIKTDYDIPYYNMALEEYIMTNDEFTDEYVFFYIHRPSVIIGRFQNAMSEVNMKFLEENDICLARRISGGGAVYHDGGNLNFSFICHKRSDGINFGAYLMPVINAIRKLGADVSLGGRNDLILDGRKFGGNAQHISKDKVLTHGTLMTDVNIENMTGALNVDPEKYTSRGIASVRSRVVNLNEFLEKKMTAFQMREYLECELRKNGDMEEYVLTDEDISQVEKLVKEKFSTWEYNFGGKTTFGTVKKKKLPAGLITISYEADRGMIKNASVTGDFFADDDISVLENALIGVRLIYEDIISSVTGKISVSGLTAEEVAEIILYE